MNGEDSLSGKISDCDSEDATSAVVPRPSWTVEYVEKWNCWSFAHVCLEYTGSEYTRLYGDRKWKTCSWCGSKPPEGVRFLLELMARDFEQYMDKNFKPLKMGIWFIEESLNKKFLLWHECPEGKCYRSKDSFKGNIYKGCASCHSKPPKELVNFFKILTLPLQLK